MLISFIMLLTLTASNPVFADTTASDTLRSVDARTITVVANQESSSADTRKSPAIRNIDQLMELASASMTRRAALAAEPTIRGLHAGQVALTIDGMKIHAACVDHMDPPTAYMELASLEKLDVQRGTDDMRYGANLGGALTFTMRKPQFDEPLTAQTTVSVESNGLARTSMAEVSTSFTNLAIRAAYTYRAAHDFTSGGSHDVVGSNYEKHNMTVGGAWRIAPSQSLYADVITDVASFIGFPALLMDTRRAEGFITSLTWKGAWASGRRTSVKAYANTISHVMDDYARSISQIKQRRFMSNMFMPMTGKSITYGLLAEASAPIFGGFASAILDASWLKARADMTMHPLDSTVTPMHLINVGDASIGIIAIATKYDVELALDWNLSAQIRVEASPRTLADPIARSVLQAYTPDAAFDRVLFGSSASVSLGHELGSAVSSRLSLSTSQRMPTHLEQYGFYLYDPQGGLTTIGNPNLLPERSINLESTVTWNTESISTTVNGFVQHISNYIAADPRMQFQSGGAPPERIYGNIGDALLSGVDASARLLLADIVIADALIGYVFGKFTTIADRMPMMPPLYYRMRCVIKKGPLTGEIGISGAAAQTAISLQVRPENITPSWCIGNVGVNWQVVENTLVGVSVLNVFDTAYHDHLSINDLPSPGRNVRIVIGTRW